jgi:hypothetical protein
MRSLIVQPGGDLQAVDRMYPLEILGYITGLVGLNPADEMPGNIKALEFFEFDDRLLDCVLTEVPQSGPVGGLNRCRRLPFADCQD